MDQLSCDIFKPSSARFIFRFEGNGFDVTWTEVSKNKKFLKKLLDYFQLDQATSNSIQRMKELISRFLSDQTLTFPIRIPAIVNPAPQEKFCAVAGCRHCVSGTRLYCTWYHHKYQFLHEEREKLLALNDTFGVYLVDCILKTTCNLNPLQPNGNNGTVVVVSPPFFDNLLDWYKFMKKYQMILHAALGVTVDGKDNVKLCDQKIRAKELAISFKPLFHLIVRLMDGFGGFTMLFLDELCRQYGEHILKTLKIELVDIVHEVTLWHQQTFRCSAIHCLTEKIVDQHRAIPPTTLLYMNFCGIAESFDEVCAFLKAHPMECLLSFSLARAAKSYEHTLIGHTSSKDCPWQVCKVKSKRSNFATYHVSMK